jgi:hypothetical protein
VVAGVCLVNLVLAAPTVKIEHPKYIKGSSDIVPGRYIIKFSSKQYQGGVSFAQSFNKEFKDADLTVKEDFKHELFKGVSVGLTAANEGAQAAALKHILDRPDVASVEPVKLIPRPDTTFIQTSLNQEPSILPHALTQVNQVHDSGNKGKGTLVCVIDSGKKILSFNNYGD